MEKKSINFCTNYVRNYYLLLDTKKKLDFNPDKQHGFKQTSLFQERNIIKKLKNLLLCVQRKFTNEHTTDFFFQLSHLWRMDMKYSLFYE
jgi:hypothetical protein